MLQVGVAPGAQALEVRAEAEQLVAGGDVNLLTIDGDATQAAVPAASLPVDAGGVPVDGLRGPAAVEVDQEYAAMALTLATAAHHGSGDQGGHDAWCACTGLHMEEELMGSG
jgi:hypothetical protein